MPVRALRHDFHSAVPSFVLIVEKQRMPVRALRQDVAVAGPLDVLGGETTNARQGIETEQGHKEDPSNPSGETTNARQGIETRRSGL